MNQLVESLWRLYNVKHSITKEQVLAMKINNTEKSYILGEKELEEVKANLPSQLDGPQGLFNYKYLNIWGELKNGKKQ